LIKILLFYEDVLNLRSKTQDAVLFYFLKFLAIIVILLLFGIIGSLVYSALPAIKNFGFSFFLSKEWNPIEENFGALPFIFGTVVTSFIAVLLATPISICIALTISEYLPKKFSKILSLLVEMIAAIPSIVFGLWGIFHLIPFMKETLAPFLKTYLGFLPFFQGPSFGIGILTSSLVLAIMITPTISSVCRSVFEAIPTIQKEAALGLGATKFETIKLSIILPSLSGITSAIILGLGRALGETMAVTMLIGNSPIISSSLFSPAATMASVMANEYTDANSPLHVASLCYIALTLFLITFIANLLAKLIVGRFQKGGKKV